MIFWYRKSLRRQIKLADELIAAQDRVIESHKDLVRILKREVEILKELRLMEVGK